MSSNCMDNSSGCRMTSASSASSKYKPCLVCGDRAIGCNFGAISCESCKAFFRRNAHKVIRGRCEGTCDVTTESRSFCKKCRLRKCFHIGMKRTKILNEQQKQIRRRKIRNNKIVRRGQDESGEVDEVTEVKCEPPVENTMDKDHQTVVTLLSTSDRELLTELTDAHDKSNQINIDSILQKCGNLESPSKFFNLAEASVLRIVKFVKLLKGFKALSSDDQIGLLKGSVMEIMMLRSVTYFNSSSQTWNLQKLKTAKAETSVEDQSRRTTVSRNNSWNEGGTGDVSSIGDTRQERRDSDGVENSTGSMIEAASGVQSRENFGGACGISPDKIAALRRMYHTNIGQQSHESQHDISVELRNVYRQHSECSPTDNNTLHNNTVPAILAEEPCLKYHHLNDRYDSTGCGFLTDNSHVHSASSAATCTSINDSCESSSGAMDSHLIETDFESSQNISTSYARVGIAHSSKPTETTHLNDKETHSASDVAPSLDDRVTIFQQMAFNVGDEGQQRYLMERMKNFCEKMNLPCPGSDAQKSIISCDQLKFLGSGMEQVFSHYSTFATSIMKGIRNDRIILCLIIAIALFSVDRSTVTERASVEALQLRYTCLCQRYVALRYPQHRGMFAKVMDELTNIRNINEHHMKMLSRMKLEDIEPLLVEIFDMSNLEK